MRWNTCPTHFAVDDIALMRSMPNMTILAPADNIEAAKMVAAIAAPDGPLTGPDPETLMDAWGLSVDDVVAAARRVLQRKG